MEMRGLMGGFYRISEWIMRLAAINLMWIVCSIPFFLLLLSTLFIPEPTSGDLFTGALMLGAVSPFTLVPATTAMFAVARKWVMGDVDVPLFKTYFKNYKDNYKQSMLGGLIFLALGILIVVCIYFYSRQSSLLHILTYLFISLSVVYVAAFINFVSLTVHFHMGLKQLIKNSFIMTLGQPVISIGILLTNGIIVYISFAKFTFLIPFFMGSLCAFVSFWYFYRSFQRMQDRAEKAREKEAEEALGLEDESLETKR